MIARFCSFGKSTEALQKRKNYGNMLPMETHKELIDALVASGVLKTPRIVEAFGRVDRAYFIPEELRQYAYIDAPLSIGEGQTISQPWTVAFMLELLQPKEGDRVLDIGSGSGWTTALLCEIVGAQGSVTGLERVDRLVAFGRKNLERFHKPNCRIEKAGASLGKPGETFDAILVSASADEIPVQLFEQLAPGGRLVIPVRDSIFSFEKDRNGELHEREFPGFRFVPLIYHS